MLLAFGVIFQMRVGSWRSRAWTVTRASPAASKYAILIIFILAVVITPSSDVVNQSIMAGLMIVLYMLEHRDRVGLREEEGPRRMTVGLTPAICTSASQEGVAWSAT
jgi:uncharacterized membrane protein (DUF2068 family)